MLTIMIDIYLFIYLLKPRDYDCLSGGFLVIPNLSYDYSDTVVFAARTEPYELWRGPSIAWKKCSNNKQYKHNTVLAYIISILIISIFPYTRNNGRRMNNQCRHANYNCDAVKSAHNSMMPNTSFTRLHHGE